MFMRALQGFSPTWSSVPAP